MDKFKTKEYFEKYRDVQYSRIFKFESIFETAENELQKKKCAMFLAGLYRDLISCEISLDIKGSDIVKSVESYLFYLSFDDSLSLNEYIDALAMAIIYKCDEKNVRKIVQLNERLNNGIVMYLLDVLNIDSTIVTEESYDYYNPFEKYISNVMSDSDFISFINTDWYKSCSDMYWYNSHLSDEEVYTGYWCFLGTALLIIKGCNIYQSDYLI